MARKIHKLKGFQPEQFKVICIACHQNHYRLSWALNQALNIQLQKAEDLFLKHNKTNIDQSFSKYTFQDKNSPFTYHLICNKSEKGYLLKELPNIDFFLKIEGETDDGFVSEVINKIKKLEIVITAFELKPIKNVQYKKLTF